MTDFIVGRVVFSSGGDTVKAGEGKLSLNPLEYAPKGTLEELRQARARVQELEGLVREMDGENPMTPAEYLKKPYTYCLVWDEESQTWTGKVKEFPGCIAQSGSSLWIVDELEKAALSWIAAALDQGQEMPEPGEVQS